MSLFLVPMWWPAVLGGEKAGFLMMLVGIGIFMLAILGGWAYSTWHNPREGLLIAAWLVPAVAVMVTAQWLEEQHGINWWLTTIPAIGVVVLISRRLAR